MLVTCRETFSQMDDPHSVRLRARLKRRFGGDYLDFDVRPAPSRSLSATGYRYPQTYMGLNQ